MPTSLIEAFAAGLPVVTTSAGGIPYIVRHEENGLLVPPGDDAELARQALRLLRDPDLAPSLTEAARAECESRYTWPVVRNQWVGLYRRLAAGTLSEAARGEGVGQRSTENATVADTDFPLLPRTPTGEPSQGRP